MECVPFFISASNEPSGQASQRDAYGMFVHLTYLSMQKKASVEVSFVGCRYLSRQNAVSTQQK